jgi:cell division protein FtsB
MSRRRPAAGARAHGARRTSARRGVRVAQRPRAVGALLAAIVIIFSVAFLSLSQSVRVAATSYDIVRLVSESERLSAQKVDLHSNVERLSSEPAIRKQALDAGLGQLGAPVVLPAR